ncbi:uncharacterized protein LOC125031782 [Penaeus chinensis]|uniref:uncharacterized protein LOC125031782 n=1 Tax=Penaeus chinensis TaxID=139456 RepID=UPI001FB81CBD|nr:uncharacterized protein LOC125031782 [Penaeus chinensis]
MSDYPAQDAFYGVVGDTYEYLNASLICGTQSSNVCEDEEYIANFDLDLLAAELWPEASVAGAASDLTFCEGTFNATSLYSQDEDLMGLGAVNPNDLFSSGMQPPYPSSYTPDGYVPYQYCEQQATSSYCYKPQSHLSPYNDNLGESFQQMNIFQPHDQHSGYAYHNDHQMGVQQPHQQSGISHDQQFDVLQNQGVATACVSRSGTSKKRKGYRHRHQRQFLSSAEERDRRSRVLNNEASAIYRKKMRDLHDKARTELDDLEQRNQQLTQRFRLLQKFCSGYKARLEALGVPVTSSFQ